jgi:DNA-binding transcriptional MocR family regulator
MVLAEYYTDNFDAHVRTLRHTLRRKFDALIEALHIHFGTPSSSSIRGIFL